MIGTGCLENSFIIKTDCGIFESNGSNDYPSNWNKFRNSIEKVVENEFRL